MTGLALLLVLGLVFSVAYGSRRITVAAATLHDADETLRSATVVRAQVGLAVHLSSVDQQFGTNSAEALDTSLGEVKIALRDVAAGVEQLYMDVVTDPAVKVAADGFSTTSRQVLQLLEDGDAFGAKALADTQLDAGFQELVGLIVEVRNDLNDDVKASDQLLGRIGNLARFLVAFLIPAAVIIVYRELVRRQQRQAELETRLEAERQLNAAREDFIANASHELRTPLTSILGLSMMLAETEAVRGEPAASELLDIIIGESDDLSRMVDDLLTVARLDAGAIHYSFEDVDVAAEIEHIVDPLQRAGMNLTFDCAPGVLRADRLRFRQVIRNLLSNARKYGGPDVRIEGRPEGRTYLVSVIDNGSGIPADIAPRLFERFIHQGHETASRDSVGLGLSIVHALSHGMGGSVNYHRIEDETVFVLRLPIPTAMDAELEASVPAAGWTDSNRPLAGAGVEFTLPYEEEGHSG